MSAVVRRRSRVAVLVAAAALSLGPVLLGAPAEAAETSPPVATEPPGGATCLPGSTDCGQETGATSTATTTPAPSTTPSPAVTTLPDTGSAPRTGPAPRQLAHTGDAASGWGYTGTGLLVGGSLLVLAARRRGSRA